MKLFMLSEICTFSRGLTYSKSDEVDFSNNVVLRANNIDLHSNSLNLEDLRYIKDSIQIKKEKIAKKNSLIICTASGSKSHVGKVALIDEDYGYAFGGFMGQLTPTDKCHPKFLYYVLTSGLFKDFLMSLNDGTNINNLKFSDIENYEILLPSLEKQHEIVGKLDIAFAEIDLLQNNFDSIESLINECDVSILGRTLNSSIGELGGHRISTLGDTTNLISRGISPTYLDSASTVVLNQRCIRDGRVDLNFSRRHDEKARRVQETKLLQDGDGLVNSTGVGTLGRTALFDHPGTGEFTVDSHVTIVRPKSDTLDSGYFGLVLRALENVFVSLSTGTSGQTELPREAIKETVITFPDNLDEQKDFFKYYSSLNSAVAEFRKRLLNKRVLSENLRVSLLSSAFTGVEEVA